MSDVLDYVKVQWQMSNKHLLWITAAVGFLIGLYVK